MRSAVALAAVVGWPALATVLEASRAHRATEQNALAGIGIVARSRRARPTLLRESGGLARPLRLALETIGLVLATEAIALPLGILLALLLFRTDVLGPADAAGASSAWRRSFRCPCTRRPGWVRSATPAGPGARRAADPGRPTGAAVVHALAALPWVVLIVGVGLCAVEPELEESALSTTGRAASWCRVTLRRALGAIAAAALAVAVLTAGDMTVTDLLQIRTYAEEAYLQYSLGRGPGEAALVALPPLVVLGMLILLVGRALSRFDPARLVSSFARARRLAAGPLADSRRRAAGGSDRQRDGAAALQPDLACRPGRRPSDAGPAPDLVALGIGGHPAVRGRRDLGAACRRACSGRPSPPRLRPRSPARWPGPLAVRSSGD